MLTRDLLLFRIRETKIRPSFVDVERPDLASLASDLVGIVEGSIGQSRDAVDELLEARGSGFPRLKVARGLCKLLLDRMVFEEPEAEVAAERQTHFAAAAAVLRGLPLTASIEDYELRLQPALPAPLDEIRGRLYADLPGQRALLEWRKLSPRGLLERYNRALAQGLVLYSRTLRVEAQKPDLLRVRRVLRWLKFCRLVAQVSRQDENWTLEVEGPAAILSMAKKYGLQLATFLPAVPVLQRWRLEAEIQLPRRGTFTLELSHKDPLVSMHDEALGHIPPEIAQIAARFQGGPWQLDLTPEPRPVGAKDLCVPDLSFRHRKSGLTVCFELFHRWHHHALARRLEGLRSRPDPHLYLGVDRALARQPEMKSALEAFPQAMVFNLFPSEKKIREILAGFLAPAARKRGIVRPSGANSGQEESAVESPRSGKTGAARSRDKLPVARPRRGRRGPGSGSGRSP